MSSNIPLSDWIPVIEDLDFESSSLESVRTLVGGAALLYYDYLLTLSDEVRLAWLRPRSLASVLFLVIRYMALLNMAVAMTIQLPDIHYLLSDASCETLVKMAFAGHAIVSAAVSAFVAARIMALWSRNWCLGVFLFIAGMINWSPYVQSVLVGYQSAAAPWPLQGCMAVSSNSNLDEIVVRSACVEGNPSMLNGTTIGSVYFAVMAILGVLNIVSATPVGSSKFPMGNNLNEAFSRSLVPILTTRFIAHLKDAGFERHNDSTYVGETEPVTTLRFNPPTERMLASVAGPLDLFTEDDEGLRLAHSTTRDREAILS
ncbi:hypothetical protein OH77DRAFT_1523854 [Trametes cingulata]|nr:hypothetical protein OH77DRAFT_1523854 [Trametes cingulata]